MPIHTSKVVVNSVIREVELLPGNNSDVNTTNFAFLRHTDSTPVDWATLNRTVERDVSAPKQVGLDNVTPDPYEHILMYGHSSANVIAAILLKDALMPGEKVTISGYFFNGSNPFVDNGNDMNNTAASDCHLSVYYEDDWVEFSTFDASPSANESLSSSQAGQRKNCGRGIVPASNGSNIGTVDGWMYSMGEDDSVFKKAPDTATNTGRGMLNLSYFKAENSGLSRFFKITIRNDSSNRARLKLFNQRGAGGVGGDYMGMYGVKAKFESTKSERIECPIFGHGIDFSRDNEVRINHGVNRVPKSSESSDAQYNIDEDLELPVIIGDDTTQNTKALRYSRQCFVRPAIYTFQFAYSNTTDRYHALPIGGTYSDNNLGNQFETIEAETHVRYSNALFFKGKMRILKIIHCAELASFDSTSNPPTTPGSGPHPSKAAIDYRIKFVTNLSHLDDTVNLSSNTGAGDPDIPETWRGNTLNPNTGGQYNSMAGHGDDNDFAHTSTLSEDQLRYITYDAGSTGAYLMMTIAYREYDSYYNGGTYVPAGNHTSASYLTHGPELFGTLVIQFGDI